MKDTKHNNNKDSSLWTKNSKFSDKQLTIIKNETNKSM